METKCSLLYMLVLCIDSCSYIAQCIIDFGWIDNPSGCTLQIYSSQPARVSSGSRLNLVVSKPDNEQGARQYHDCTMLQKPLSIQTQMHSFTPWCYHGHKDCFDLKHHMVSYKQTKHFVRY